MNRETYAITNIMCDKQTLNIEAVYDFWQACSQKKLNTVIVAKAKVAYFDEKRKVLLYESESLDDVFIDTVAEDNISIPSLPDNCYCKFTTKFQDMKYDKESRSLIIAGKGYPGSGKNDYTLTLIAS